MDINVKKIGETEEEYIEIGCHVRDGRINDIVRFVENLEGNCYETTRKLYEFEELLKGRSFLRISKSVVLNIMKVDSIKPALNGRFSCILRNGEEVIISRKYVNPFKEFISKKV